MSESSEPTVEQGASGHWEQEFARRILLTEPTDTIRGMFCTGMLRIVGSLGGEEVMRRCQEASGEEKFVDFFNYPMAVYLRMISAAVRLLADRYGSVEEALRQLGRQALAAIDASAAGKALVLMRTGDMRSTVESLRVGYRIAVSSGEPELVWTGPTSARLTLRRVFMPHPFHEGLLMATFERQNLQGLKVLGRQTGALDSEYELSWT
jgi:uncharacterized protein (TIGR02265 family)